MFIELRELLCSGAVRRHQLGSKVFLSSTDAYELIQNAGKGGELYANDRKEKKDHGLQWSSFCVVFRSFSQCETGKQRICGRESCHFLYLAE
ncbi:MAG: hypothetical protein ACLR6B_01395 [Blautia sp.]